METFPQSYWNWLEASFETPRRRIVNSDTVSELLTWVLANYDSVYFRVKQDGRYRSLPLSEIKDETQIANFVIGLLDQLKHRVKAASVAD